MGNPCPPGTKMPRRGDSSPDAKEKRKKEMKQINSGVSRGEDQTTAQHDNDHKSTQALRLPPERRLFK